jgi:tetratricopeptide (TPR) repeat protein
MPVRVALFMGRHLSPWLLLAFLSACAGLAPQETRPVREEGGWAVAKQCAKRGQDYERKGDLAKAVYFWQIVARLAPGDRKLADKIQTLRERIRIKAEEHYAKGVQYFAHHDLDQARKEFLSVLLYDPDHEQALAYVKRELVDQDYAFYRTQPGDTPQTVAQRQYGDQSMAFVVAYFNDLDERGDLAAGSTLQLPIIAEGTSKGPPHLEEMLAMARALYAAGEYRQSIPLARGVLTQDPTNKEAAELWRASAYEAGRNLLREKRYLEALQAFKGLSPKYRDVGEIVQILEKNLQKQAEDHYRKGVAYYAAGDLGKAIAEWDETLRLNPAHAKARQDLKKATRLRDQLDREQ